LPATVGVVITEISETALTAAAARAAHLIVDHEPHIFCDPLAETLLGERADELLAYHRLHGDHPVLAGARAQVTCRARLAEGRVSGSGLDQYVVLGAGLDSFAYRTTVHTRVFEVDGPATQAWKRERVPAATTDVRYVPVDFERDDLAAGLAHHGFDAGRPAVVSWLGVSMYLTSAGIDETLSALARLAAGSEIVLDYFLPEAMRDERGRLYAEQVGPVSAERGEPWRTVLAPDELTEILAAHGWTTVDHIGQSQVAELQGRSDSLRPSRLSMLAHGRRPGGVASPG
jgi:methyltransferase (TIGR00027 family)